MKKLVVFCIIIAVNFIFTLTCIADTVVYNTKTGKIHSPVCEWARKCTVNCIRIERKDAQQRGGVPCKVCGGR